MTPAATPPTARPVRNRIPLSRLWRSIGPATPAIERPQGLSTCRMAPIAPMMIHWVISPPVRQPYEQFPADLTPDGHPPLLVSQHSQWSVPAPLSQRQR